MNLNHPAADWYVPDGSPDGPAMARTTHLGIGAHQDDLEFMAMDGILKCYQLDTSWFGGITCSNGGGSARSGAFEKLGNADIQELRIAEQREAARLGQYAFMAQLAYPSEEVKDPARRANLVKELAQLIGKAQPEIIYTHNPFDRHPTHIGVLIAVLDAIRSLPQASRPKQLMGCEVWRSLDWLPDCYKLRQPVDTNPQLATDLRSVFKSQIDAGKRYDLAVEGRLMANATFDESHGVDQYRHLALAVDLSALIEEDGQSLSEFIEQVLHDFNQECRNLPGNLI